MITLINKTTGESVNVYDVKIANGVIVAGMHNGKEKGKKFISQYSHVFTEYHNEEGVQCFRLCEGWEVEKTARKPRTPKPATKPEAVPASEATPTEATPAQPDVVPAPTDEKPTEEKPARKPRRGPHRRHSGP